MKKHVIQQLKTSAMLKMKLNTLGEELTHWRRLPNAGRDWGQRKRMTGDEMAG